MGITQADLANRQDTKFEFGMSNEAAVAALRGLADDLEAGRALIQQATLYRKFKIDDYPMSVVVLKFHETTDTVLDLSRPEGIRELYSADSKFPVDAKRIS
jgi:hypothetical protein